MTSPIDLMIIGAQKAATSSLHHYLAQHPNICTHSQREMTYFIDDNEYQQDYRDIYKRYFNSHNTNHTAITLTAWNVLLWLAVRRRLKIESMAFNLFHQRSGEKVSDEEV